MENMARGVNKKNTIKGRRRRHRNQRRKSCGTETGNATTLHRVQHCATVTPFSSGTNFVTNIYSMNSALLSQYRKTVLDSPALLLQKNIGI